MLPYASISAFVQHLAPTWRKTQQVNFAQLIAAVLERENLALSDLARAFPRPAQRLRGRLKRLDRFLDNPRLDEAALFARWLKLSYRIGEDAPRSRGRSLGSRSSSTRSTSSRSRCWPASSRAAVGACRSP